MFCALCTGFNPLLQYSRFTPSLTVGEVVSESELPCKGSSPHMSYPPLHVRIWTYSRSSRLTGEGIGFILKVKVIL